jgi:TonB family protein
MAIFWSRRRSWVDALPVFVWLLLATVVGAQTRANGDLARARDLYSKAYFEEALALLPEQPLREEREEVELHRALCLIALGRVSEAERAFGRLLAEAPGFRLGVGEAAPHVVALFDGVRQRVLPGTAEAAYARGKADLTDGNYDSAALWFAHVVALASDPAVANGGRMFELGLLAQEFLSTTKATLGRTAATTVSPAFSKVGPAAPLKSATLVAPPVDTAAPEPATIYSMLDHLVKPPVELSREMPPWDPPREFAWRTFRGVVEVIVGTDGRVEQVHLLERLAPFYDAALVAAAHHWQFKPATRNGRAVPFRHQLQITMRPARTAASPSMP